MTSGLWETDTAGWGLPLHPEAICLSEAEITRAAAVADGTEEGWTRYLRGLALAALRRRAAITIGPVLEPEAPDRLLVLNGRATQLLCVSPLAQTVEVPLHPWQETARAPQLLVVAQVHEDHGTVQILGVLDAAGFVAAIHEMRAARQATVEMDLDRFGGGFERLLRWLTLLEAEALPRVGLNATNASAADGSALMAALQQWLAELVGGATLMPLAVVGTRGAGAEVQLVTPQVSMAVDGSATAQAVCANPSIWAATPLAEILLEREGTVVWRQLATRRNPIEGPIAWPLAALQPGQQTTIRLRPWGMPGGAYAVLTLIAGDGAALDKGMEAIRKQLEDDQPPAAGDDAEDQAVAAEVRARLWLRLKIGNEKGEG